MRNCSPSRAWASKADRELAAMSGRVAASAGAVVRVDDAYLSLKTLAVYAGLSVRTLRGYLTHAAHPLPSYRIGGRVLVKRSEFDAWAAPFRRGGQGQGDGFKAMVEDVLGALQ